MGSYKFEEKPPKSLIGKKVVKSPYGLGIVSSVSDKSITFIFRGKVKTLPYPECMKDVEIYGMPMREAQSEAEEPEVTCEDCIELSMDRCQGENKICEDFRWRPRMTEKTKSIWPTEGDVLYKRRTGKWREAQEDKRKK